MFKKIVYIILIVMIFSCSNPLVKENNNNESLENNSRGTYSKFSIVLFPDPQKYTEAKFHHYDSHPKLSSIYSEQTKWIRDNKNNPKYKIKHVLVLGDITQDNDTYQWEIANNAFKILDNAGIPYSISTGNHDYTSKRYLRSSKFSRYFGPNRFKNKSWYGGSFTSEGINNYTFLNEGGVEFLILNLEFNPRKKVITWADHIISKYPNKKIILNTHNYLASNGSHYSGNRSSGGTRKDYWGNRYEIIGTEHSYLFKEFVSRHSNMLITTSGHIASTAYKEYEGFYRNKIHSILCDFQHEPVQGSTKEEDELGNGWLQLLHIDPVNNKLEIETINVLDKSSALHRKVFKNNIQKLYLKETNKYMTNTDKIYSIPNVDLKSRSSNKHNYNANILFKDFAANTISTGQQLRPRITGNKFNGSFMVTWADDNNNDNSYNLIAQQFRKDGKALFYPSNGKNVDKTIAYNISKYSITDYEIDMNDAGQYIITWETGKNIYAFISEHNRKITVNNITRGVQTDPDVAIDEHGNFVVTWEDDNDGNGTYQVYARAFYHNGNPITSSFTVNGKSKGNQISPVIEMFDNGDYIIAYEDDTGKNGKNEDIYIKGYEKRSNKVKYNDSKEIRYAKKGHLRNIEIAVQNDKSKYIKGNQFAVVWEDDIDGNGYYEICGIHGSVNFSSSWRISLSNVITINNQSSGNQLDPSVSMNKEGEWVTVWEDDSDKNGKYDIFYQTMIGSTKKVISPDQIVNRDSTGNQINPSVIIDNNGYITVAWEDDVDGNGKKEILVRNLLYSRYTF